MKSSSCDTVEFQFIKLNRHCRRLLHGNEIDASYSPRRMLHSFLRPIYIFTNNKGIEHFLRHMGSDPKLLHAFPVLNPALPESERVIDEIVVWFKNHEPLNKKES